MKFENLKSVLVTLSMAVLAVGCAPEQELEEPASMTETRPAAEPETTQEMTARSAMIGVRTTEPYGQHLVDDSGMSLYLFKKDEGQQGSTCYDSCAQVWPPLMTDGEPSASDPTVQTGMLGTITRTDGTTQVTYGGWPLYYYAQDQQPGDARGQDIVESGAEWYLVTPAGEEVHAEESES